MRKVRLALASVALMIGGNAAAAVQLRYSSVYVFGDSLVDSGNARIASLQMGLPDPAPPTQGYAGGRFSNGANFADYASQQITGQPATAALQGGRNYAVGGALAGFQSGETRPSFLAQVGLFGPQAIASDALVIVTFGGNDIRATVTTPGRIGFADAIADLRTGLDMLVAAGAQNIVVTGLPDIGTLPGVVLSGLPLSQRALLTQRSEFLNNRFQGVTGDVRDATGARLRFFDLLELQRGVFADPASFGLPASLNTAIPCQLAGPAAVSSGCNGFLYFDAIHPTTKIHQAIASGVLGVAAVPEPSTWAMLIGGVGAVGAALRRATRRRRASGIA